MATELSLGVIIGYCIVSRAIRSLISRTFLIKLAICFKLFEHFSHFLSFSSLEGYCIVFEFFQVTA